MKHTLSRNLQKLKLVCMRQEQIDKKVFANYLKIMFYLEQCLLNYQN